MSDDARSVLDEVAALVGRGRQRDRVVAARSAASEQGRDPDMAAREAAREPLPPLKLAGETPGVHDGHQHPVVRARIQRIRAAMDAGRLTPAESTRVFEAMSADEAAATALLDRLPEGRVPLQPRAVVPDPEGGPLAGVAPGDTLPDGVSILSRAQRDEIAERRRR